MLESKAFYRKIEHAFAGSERARTRERFALRLAPRLLEQLGGPLGLVAVHLYERRGRKLVAARRWGEGRTDLHEEIEARLGSNGDDAIRELPWVGETSTGRAGLFAVGALDGPLIAVFPAASGDVRAVPSHAELLSALNSIVYAVRQRLERGRLEDLFEQARTIQLSLLPEGRREFAGYDVFASSTPAQSVGGDLYDYHDVDPETLGFAVADASGHGLPAALQARDVATGLRMGVERDLKITRMVERLNRVIHQSGLTSRFISLFFGELERNGNLSYINAGHPPPLLVDTRGIRELTVGGMLLGPDPQATYKMGFVHVDRGACLVAYTDGVLERENAGGEIYGLDRLGAWLGESANTPCEEAVAELLRRLSEFGGGGPFEDDVTVMMVRRI
ncbi:MAG TPA: PP2C family protein-serine/threonine phosphatase [Candidatus Eisenbacteria bacterium]|jgi:sigma-B regulation protein RsbU (phosphoserine phosphatase)